MIHPEGGFAPLPDLPPNQLARAKPALERVVEIALRRRAAHAAVFPEGTGFLP